MRTTPDRRRQRLARPAHDAAWKLRAPAGCLASSVASRISTVAHTSAQSLGHERPQALFESLVAGERVMQKERDDPRDQEHESAAQHQSPEPARPRRAGKGEARQQERDLDAEAQPDVRFVMPRPPARGFA